MKKFSEILNDNQIAAVVIRGGAFQLLLTQEETTDDNGAVVAAAKSYSITNREAAVALRDLLNKALEVEVGA